MADKWIPNYIKRNIGYRPKDVLTAQEYNAILNLIIAQGDYNSSWLEYLQEEGIPDAVAEIGIEEIEAVLTEVVRQELNALAHQVNNKTSGQLNAPAVSILNTGIQIAPWQALVYMLEDKHVPCTLSVATNLVGTSTAYPTLEQINTIREHGFDFVAYSTDAATVTDETAAAAANSARQFMDTNSLNNEVFVYPSGNTSDTVATTVHNYFMYAVNIINNATIIPDGITSYAPASVLGNLAVIKCDDTVDTEVIKGYIDNIVEHNKYMILQVDTDSEHFDLNQLEEVVDYMLTKSSIQYPASISAEMHTIHNTIGNLLDLVSGIAITEVDGEKYINW